MAQRLKPTPIDLHDEQGHTPEALPREATFRPPSLTRGPEDDAPQRAASFRPREDVAQRNDALEDFLIKAEDDVLLDVVPAHWRGEVLLSKALVEEAMGQLEVAASTLQDLRRQHGLDARGWRIMRRIGRAMHDVSLIDTALSHSAEAETPVSLALVTLEAISRQWRQGAPRELVGLGCSEVGRWLELDADDAHAEAVIDWWRCSLLVDAALSASDLVGALETLEDLDVTHLEDPMRRVTLVLRALLARAIGEPERALAHLEPLRTEVDLAPALRGLMFALLDDTQQGMDACEWLPAEAPALAADAVRAAYAAYTQGAGFDVVEAYLAGKHDHDPLALEVRAEALEAAIDAGHEDAAEQLIHVLNLRLEAAPEDTPAHERVAILLRLGALYERHAGLDRAAAEVYREAKAIDPTHATVLRALGRVYARRGDWHLLTTLFEHEIANQPGSSMNWRRHFQVAELYEQRLEEEGRALEHYERALALRPNFLPAVKACARLMERSGQWSALADLFLTMVPVTPSKRQRLYLLDKVAEIAEHKLKNLEVAAGAWREMLDMVPDHPTAYASLGRLYARLERWDDLLALNADEMELIEDVAERAALAQRNAEICLSHKDDPRGAESWLRQALADSPDHLPALEALGRLLASEGRWDELAMMWRDEFSAGAEPEEQLRQLDVVAEMCARKLGRPGDAIALYEEVLRRKPSYAQAHHELARLYQRTRQWPKLSALYARRSEATPDVAERASLHGRLGMVRAFHLGDGSGAYDDFKEALRIAPDDTHWLAGVMRHRHDAGVDAGHLSRWLDSVAAEATKPAAKDALTTARARLVEQDTEMPEAALGLRHSAPTQTLEHRLMRRVSLGLLDEREPLERLRKDDPVHALEWLTVADRVGLNLDQRKLLAHAAAHIQGETRDWFLEEIEVSAVTNLAPTRDVGVEAARLVAGDDLAPGTNPTLPAQLRLRQLLARARGDEDMAQGWVRAELEHITDPEFGAWRLLELSRHAAPKRRSKLLHEAALLAFPELDEVGADAPTMPLTHRFDGAVIESLYDALYADRAFSLLRRCLEVHVRRAGLSTIRRAYLWDMLSDLLERALEELDAAYEARMRAWELGGEPEHLVRLVGLSEELERYPEAITFQRAFYDSLIERPLATVENAVDVGLELADLLLEHGAPEDGEECLDIFRDLELITEGEDALHTRVLLAHARAEGAIGSPRLGAELYRRVLEDLDVASNLDHWRRMIALWRDVLGDSPTAYMLQWTLVRHDPTDDDALGALVELAEESDALTACAEELVRLARTQDGELERALTWRAATIYDEFLGRSDEALVLYERLMELAGDDPEERVRARRRLALCLGQARGRQREALTTFRELADEAPFDVPTYRGMAALLDSVQTYDRARVVDQVRRTLGDALEREPLRTKHVPSRTLFDSEVMERLLPEELKHGVLQVLVAAVPLAERVFSDELPQRKAIENKRHASREFAEVQDLMIDLFDALGLKRPRVWFGDSNPAPVEVVHEASPLVWMNVEALERFEEPELRFLAGWCAALAATELPMLRHIDGRRMWHLLDGLSLRQRGKGFDERVDIMSQDLAESIGSPLFAVSRRRAFSVLEEHLDVVAEADSSQWPAALEQLAIRLGMVVCGDVEAAARCMLKLDGWAGDLTDAPAQKLIRRHPQIRELIRFALSEDFLHARYQLGLAGRPSSLVF